MQTPPGIAGELTEVIMVSLRRREIVPDNDVSKYNRAFEAVYEALRGYFGSDTVREEVLCVSSGLPPWLASAVGEAHSRIESKRNRR